MLFALRLLRPHPTVSDLVFTGQIGHRGPHGLDVLTRQIRPSGVELLVERDELGPLVGQMVHEVLAGAGTHEEQVRPNAGRTCLAGGADDLGELLGSV